MAASTPSQPTTPGLEFAFRITAQIGPPRSGGLSPKGERLHIEIFNGVVKGPRLDGVILPGGSDWPLVRADGTSEITARYTILSADGIPIQVENNGLRVSSPEVLKRLRAGEDVDPSEFYFRSAPVFEAPQGPHDWLNNTMFVASLCRVKNNIVIDVYCVT